MKKVITILLIILVLAAGVGFGVCHHKSNETKFNDDYITATRLAISTMPASSARQLMVRFILQTLPTAANYTQ